MTSHPDIDVSIILPVYNERDHLEDELARIRKVMDGSRYSYELIVVDDGSTDGSSELLRQMDDIHLIQFASNRGSGSSRRVGSRAARGRVVVWTDVDMTYPNDEIPDLVDALEGHDQVVGARRTEEGTIKALRVPAKWTIRQLAQYLVETPIPDLNSGFRAFRRDVGDQFLHLLPAGFSCVTTLTLSFLSNGYSVRYVPIDYAKRSGRSKFHWWADTRRYLVQVVRMVLSYAPLRVFGPIGIALTLVALAKLAFDWIARDFSLSANTIVLFFAAFNVFSIGLLADLVVRVTKPQHEVPPAGMAVSPANDVTRADPGATPSAPSRS